MTQDPQTPETPIPGRQDFRTAILEQPHWLSRAATLAADALRGRPLPHWDPADAIAVVAMGASTNAGAVFTQALREVGVRAVNLDASAVAHYPQGFCPAEHVIVVSESGRSPEPIAAIERMGVEPVVVTNDPASPVAGLGAIVVPLGGFMDSGVYTIGYTTTLVALAAIARAYGVDLADPAALAGVAQNALDEAATVAPGIAAQFDTRAFLDIVGHGISAGSAQAAALLFRESTGMPAAAHETIQYLHGPMESCGPDAAVLLFGGEREWRIAEQLRAAGTLAVQLEAPVAGYPAAVAEIVWAQSIAAELAGLRHRTVGRFRFAQPDTKLP